jgi:hypothetical protein
MDRYDSILEKESNKNKDWTKFFFLLSFRLYPQMMFLLLSLHLTIIL